MLVARYGEEGGFLRQGATMFFLVEGGWRGCVTEEGVWAEGGLRIVSQRRWGMGGILYS